MLPGHASASGAGQLQADTTCATPQPEVKSASWHWKLDGCTHVIAGGGVHLLGCITHDVRDLSLCLCIPPVLVKKQAEGNCREFPTSEKEVQESRTK